MTATMLRLLVSGAAAVAVIVGVWAVMRLWQARTALGRVRDERRAEDALRATAEAILAARLGRGEIDQATYEQLMERLWGLPATPRVSGTPPASGAFGVQAPGDAAAMAPPGRTTPPAPR